VQIVDVSFQIRDVGSEKASLDVFRWSRCGESAGSEEREEEAPRQKQLLIGWWTGDRALCPSESPNLTDNKNSH
jgi:hypothetical protein